MIGMFGLLDCIEKCIICIPGINFGNSIYKIGFLISEIVLCLNFHLQFNGNKKLICNKKMTPVFVTRIKILLLA